MHPQLMLVPKEDSVPTFSRQGHNWSYKGPWFSISAILPGQQFSHPSVAINFNITDLAGLTLALGGRWLHDEMLFATGAPVTHEHRGFVVGSVPGLAGQVIDLASARLRLPDEVVEELASVADTLSAEVLAAYLALESRWGAHGLPFVTWAGDRVALGVIDRRAWDEIMAFTRAHDVTSGDGPWHMFDAAPNVMKPYVIHPERHGGRFDTGYHGVFYASSEVDVELAEDRLAILWQPHDRDSNEELSARRWWPCDFAQRWLVDELLPEVRRWVLQREFPSLIDRLVSSKAISRFESTLESLIALRDLRHLPLLEDERLAVPTREAVERLQSFFNAAHSQPHAFIGIPVVEALYAALALLTRQGCGYIGYVAGSLGLSASPETHQELEMAILSQVREHKVVASAPVVDYALRAALEMLPEDGELMRPSTNDALRRALVPLARVHDDAELARRHRPPVG